ncbi:MAG: hypothetical protein QW279_12735 [Candidatus Jordarchaeaceae archaeon]
MNVRSCRDCENYEERRDIDGTSLCAKNIGPFVCCEEFEPRKGILNQEKFYNRFCIECLNFDEVNGINLCKKNHTSGKGCDLFRNRITKLNAVRQNNQIKSVFLVHATKNFENNSLPIHLMEIKRKIKL